MWSAGARRRRQRVGSSRSPIDDRSPGPKASVLRARHDDAANECRDRCFAVERVRAVHDQAGLDGPLARLLRVHHIGTRRRCFDGAASAGNDFRARRWRVNLGRSDSRASRSAKNGASGSSRRSSTSPVSVSRTWCLPLSTLRRSGPDTGLTVMCSAVQLRSQMNLAEHVGLALHRPDRTRDRQVRSVSTQVSLFQRSIPPWALTANCNRSFIRCSSSVRGGALAGAGAARNFGWPRHFNEWSAVMAAQTIRMRCSTPHAEASKTIDVPQSWPAGLRAHSRKRFHGMSGNRG